MGVLTYIAISLGVLTVIYFAVVAVIARLFINSANLLEDLNWSDED